MSKARVQVINGITYPREVPSLPGMPQGWVGIEQAYGPKSKSPGATYVRYKSLDGRHRQIMGPKQVIQIHCDENGLDFAVEFAKYEDALKEKKAREQEERDKEREARGQMEGERREELIALSRKEFGELSGQIVLGFPGWKCRWDYLPDSGQTPKTFIADDGREWKLLKDIECMFGHQVSQGSPEVEKIRKMVEAGHENTTAHALFNQGGATAKQTQTSCTIDPATEGVTTETAEEKEARRAERKMERGNKRSRRSKYSLSGFHTEVRPIQEGWAALTTLEDRQTAFVEFKRLLLKRAFSDTVELLAIHDVAEECRYAARISGIYYEMPALLSERRCYQKLLSAPKVMAEVCCDRVYILWNATQAQWQICTALYEGAPCVGYCKDGADDVKDVQVAWQLNYLGDDNFREDGGLKVMAAP